MSRVYRNLLDSDSMQAKLVRRERFVVRLLMVLGGLFLACVFGLAKADTGLVHSNTAGFLGPLEGTSAARSWVRPIVDTPVLSCVEGTAPDVCIWGNPAMKWNRFGDLTPGALVNTCKANITAGPFAPPNRPEVDPACGDPCGCGDALDQKGNVLKSQVVTASVPTPSNGRLVLSWTPPTENTDGSPLTDLSGYRIYSAGGTAELTLLRTVAAGVTSQELTGYGPGAYRFAVAAFSPGGESVKSAIAQVDVIAAPKIPKSPTGVGITQVTVSF